MSPRRMVELLSSGWKTRSRSAAWKCSRVHSTSSATQGIHCAEERDSDEARRGSDEGASAGSAVGCGPLLSFILACPLPLWRVCRWGDEARSRALPPLRLEVVARNDTTCVCRLRDSLETRTVHFRLLPGRPLLRPSSCTRSSTPVRLHLLSPASRVASLARPRDRADDVRSV